MIALLLLTAAAAAAQPQPADDSPVYGLKLEASSEIATGRIGMVQGEVGREPDRFLIEGLTILQPVQVAVITRDPSADVRVQVCKVLWTQPEREASTSGTGAVRFAFRTEGDFRIQISAAAGRQSYQLVVWAGDAARPPIQPAFMSMAAYRSQHGGDQGSGLSPVMWVIAAALVVIAGLLAVVVLRRGRA